LLKLILDWLSAIFWPRLRGFTGAVLLDVPSEEDVSVSEPVGLWIEIEAGRVEILRTRNPSLQGESVRVERVLVALVPP